MSLVTGLILGLLVMVLGAAGLTAFALLLRKREHSANGVHKPLEHP